ncbi:MAG: DNA polymerase III subunit delta' [Dissulfurispiraceae bacterium]
MALRHIAGQEKALRILFGMLKRSRVPSAMLFSGDTGIGKRLAAVNYAKALNCLKPADFDCCDTCVSCKKIGAATHPDVSFTFPEKGEIRIDAVRKLEATLFLKPLEGSKKIAIVDDADTMNINAANAFLKTLEEPPEDSLIILVSSNPDGLPDTIRSRCIAIRFYPLSRDAFKKAVSAAVGQEQVDFVSRLSMGRPGLALSGDFVKDMDWFSGLLGSMVNEDAKETWEDKEAIRAWLDMSFIFLRDMVIFKITGNESDLLYGKDSGNPGRKKDIREILDTYNALQKLRGLLDFNLNKSITWNYVASLMKNIAINDLH